MVMRYLIVGVWNTCFGYGVYALLTYWLTSLIASVYVVAMVASVLGNILAITMSFLCYKVWVFRTQGHFWREYFRCYLVYGTTALIGFALLPVLIFILNLFITQTVYVPYIAGALLTGGTVVVSFFGHQKFTFARKASPESDLS
jgi:putative flippase GtrA